MKLIKLGYISTETKASQNILGTESDPLVCVVNKANNKGLEQNTILQCTTDGESCSDVSTQPCFAP